MTDSSAQREKWDGIYRAMPPALPQAAAVLAENVHLLPPAGLALDLACGLGGNALFLARAGLQVRAVDLSPVAIERLTGLAAGLPIVADVQDVESSPLPVETFDVVVVSRFLARSLASAIAAALKPGGLLFYQTYVADKLSTSGPSNPAFLLQPNELLRLFPAFRVRYYREDGHRGELSLGRRDEAYFVGEKR